MKKILSIDGGGIRGLIPALVLAEIERRLNRPIASYFDIVAGTSTGGILALGLAKANAEGQPAYSAKDLAVIYQTHGKEIFARSFWKGVSSVGGFADESYSHAGLERVLLQYFGETELGSALIRTLITCYDIEKREPVFLKSWRSEYGTVLMKHAARATSAAPTYFEPALIPIEGTMRALVDGGVFINSPSVSAFAEAKRLYPDVSDFFMLSLGTGELVRRIPYSEAKGWGKAGWVVPLLTCMFDGVADAANYQMKMFLGDSYVRLQTDLSIASDDMDNASNGNIENLKAEAEKLIRRESAAIDKVCETLARP